MINHTPLHCTALNNSEDLAKILISQRANMNIKDCNYRMIKIFLSIIIIYIWKRKLNSKNKTPLHISLEKGSEEVGALLISKGADVNQKDTYSQKNLLLFEMI